MRALLLSALFFVPFVSFAATLSFEVDDISQGETTTATLFVIPDEEAVYTAQAVIAFDERSLEIRDVVYADGVLPLTFGQYDTQENGRMVKTGGFPGGITQKTPLITFTLTKTAGGVSVLTTEGTSELLNKDGNNILAGLDTKTLGTIDAPALPVNFEFTETSPALTEVQDVASPLVDPEIAEVDLPAAVISGDGQIPWMPLLIVLLIIFAGVAVYGIVRVGRKVRG